MSESPKAVFLSYAREDTDAARRIADALRGFGVEVWFDQNELRGGDTWDAKIRQQIRSCALFIPIISATTESRGEGYFRREWRIAVDRTHDMAEGLAYIVPVSIDATKEASASVPAEFMRFQWTRLPGGQPTPEFVMQVKRLLENPRQSTTHAPVPGGRGGDHVEAAASRPQGGAGVKLVVGAIALLVLGFCTYLALRPRRSPEEIAKMVSAATAMAEKTGVKTLAESTVAAPSSVTAPVSDKSIAVLPFENMSEDKDNNAFFADGIHEDILTNLALIPALKVVSRTSVMQYRNTSKTTRQIGTELGVAYVLEGSVRRAGNKVRVTGQLINTQSDEHVWAKAYDRDLTDVFAIQAALSQEIAGALSAAISPQTQKLIERKPTENTVAYDAYLRGRAVRNESPSSSVPALQEQEKLFKQAVELDPNFAAAWSELARVHALNVFWGIDGTAVRKAAADAAMAQAVRIAPDDPEVIGGLGTYAYYGYKDYARATAQYEKLAQLQPNNPTVYSSLGLIQRRQGRWRECIANFRRATALDPANVSIQRNALQIALMCRRWDDARAAHQRLIKIAPDPLREQLDAADGEFIATGSLAAADALLAQLTPEQREAPVALFARKNWAVDRGDFAEFKRLDQLQAGYEAELPPEYTDLAAAYVYLAAGDAATARARVAPHAPKWKERMASEPTNVVVISSMAEYHAINGEKEEALRLARRVTELAPTSGDAVDGPAFSFLLAEFYAVLGDKDHAITELDQLLRIPQNNSVAQMRADPALANLRGDPRFEALLNDPKNNAPLY